jgi:hypothetical protein
MKRIESKKLGLIFLVGFVIYMCVEVVATAVFGVYQSILGTPYLSLRGITSPWMGAVGGFLLIVLGKFNEKSPIKHWPMITHTIIGAVFITIVELVTGIILNLWLRFGIWDYYKMWGNLLGQICPMSFIYWLLLSPFAFYIDDLIRCTYYDVAGCNKMPVPKLLNYYKSLFVITRNPIYRKVRYVPKIEKKRKADNARTDRIFNRQEKV